MVANRVVALAASVTCVLADLWMYHPLNGKKFGVRSGPSFDAAKSGWVLEPGQLFDVESAYTDATGTSFLKLAGGLGWAFEYDSKGNHFCSPAKLVYTPVPADGDATGDGSDTAPQDDNSPQDKSVGDSVTHLDIARLIQGGGFAAQVGDMSEQASHGGAIRCGRPGRVHKEAQQGFDLHFVHPQLAVIPGLLSSSEGSAVVTMVEGEVEVDAHTFEKVDAMTRRIASIVDRPASSAMITISKLDAVNKSDDTEWLPEFATAPGVNFFIFLDDMPDDDSAELAFPLLGVKIRPTAGCAVLWSTVRTDTPGQPFLSHSAMPARDTKRIAFVSFQL